MVDAGISSSGRSDTESGTVMQIDLNFRGQHVVVFGGTTGINFGIASAFARQGAAVTVVSRRRENIDAAVGELTAFGQRVVGVCADVRNFESVGDAFNQAVSQLGPVDVLVSGAAGNFLCSAKRMSANGFKTVVDIDLMGTFHVIRQAYEHLRKPGACVINITAPQSTVAMRYQAHACAAKAGVDQLTRVLALEWGSEGLRINAISPGPIDGTEGVNRLMGQTDAERERATGAVPLQRLGTLDDIANLALFLASPYASYISGAVIPCDGGGAFESVKPALEAAGQAAAA
jgi:NAD(P)-dependent dehydrogenase (short-subunit alcohol dehydrogenase family)